MAAPAYGREVLERGRVLGAGDDDDGVLHRAVLLEHGDRLGDRRELLADGHVDADEALALLVDDRVDGHGGLARLAVADDQLALAAADGDERVDGLDARLDRRVDRLARDDAGRDALHRAELRRLDGALVVERAPERVDHAPDQLDADRHLDHGAGGLDRVAFLDVGVVAQDHGADGLLLEVEGHAPDAVGELQQLGGERAGEPIDLGDAVTDLDHGADGAGLDPDVELVDGGLDDRGDVVGADGHEADPLVGLERARGELVAQAFQATPDAAVDELVAQLDDHAAEDRRIDLEVMSTRPPAMPADAAAIPRAHVLRRAARRW